jgi:hypothetical protein
MVKVLVTLLSIGLIYPSSAKHRTSITQYKINNQTITFDDTLPSGNRYHIMLRARPFGKHSLTRSHDKNDQYGEVIKIDGRKFYGTDGEVPKMEIDTFAVEINGVSITVDRRKYSDLFEPTIELKTERGPFRSGVNPYESSDGKTLTVEVAGSDGAGWYYAVFRFDHSKLVFRSVKNDY